MFCEIILVAHIHPTGFISWDSCSRHVESNGLRSEISVHDYGRATIKLSLEDNVIKKFELELNGTRGEFFGDYFRIMDADDDRNFVDFNGDIYSIKEVKPMSKCLADWMNYLCSSSSIPHNRTYLRSGAFFKIIRAIMPKKTKSTRISK